MKAKRLEAAIVFAVAVLCSACHRSTLLHQYRDVAAAGWEQSEMLQFTVDSVELGGVYTTDVGVRISNLYPYQRLWLAVDVQLANPDTAFTDTLACTFVNSQGSRPTTGAAGSHYNFHAFEVAMSQGQSAVFTVRHIMRREVLPGILSIGLRVKRNDGR